MSDLSAILLRLSEIDRIQTELSVEREELAIAKRVLERLSASRLPASQQSSSRPPATQVRNDTAQPVKGLKGLFIEVLKNSEPPWLTAIEVKTEASKAKGTDVPMSSVSPKLWDLKNDGIIVRDGLKVALAERVRRTNEAPAAEATGAPRSSESGLEPLFRETADHDR